VTLGALAEIYGLSIAPEAAATSLAEHFAEELGRAPKPGDTLALGPIVLVVHAVEHERVSAVGLRLPEEPGSPPSFVDRLRRLLRRLDPFRDH
jgi:NhaP-type Na+/H+ and K+/H+ antiporter